MKVTNIDEGPRGLNTEDGPVLVEPGQSVDVKLSDAEAKIAKATGWFDFGRASTEAAEPKADDKKAQA
jgi:hypothetical protein